MDIPANHPSASLSRADAERNGTRWVEHTARTTAVLAVLAAISSGASANHSSYTILAQAEATDEWAFYQAKSIKRHISNGQAQLAGSLLPANPESAAALTQVQQENQADGARYDQEMKDIKARAESIEARKARHAHQSFWFQLAFGVLQVGVILSSSASGSKRVELWIGAILCGLVGAVAAANAVFLLVVSPAS